MKQEILLPEWSHRISAENIGLTPLRVSISASPAERKDLARRLRIKALESLEASFTIVREAGNPAVHVTGELRAAVTQLCVVTLEPVQQDVQAPIEGWYADPARIVSIEKARQEKLQRQKGAELPMLEEETDPEPLIDGQIDLGELATQHLSLALDLYPHKRDSVLEAGAPQGEEIPAIRRNPFAALKDWKNGQKQGD